MKRTLWVALLLLLAGLLLAPLAASAETTGPVVVIEVEGVVNPLTARYVERAMQRAVQVQARMVVLTLNTPGGLDTAMRAIMSLLLEAPFPTAVFVYPGGGRATSAGMFITLAGHVAAMAPATHIGAAHPVPLGAEVDQVSDEKMTSDAAALVRSVATRHGRNAEWAERAVRESLSLTAEEALEEGVIDLMAVDLDDLLRRIDGRVVETTAGEVTLRTAGAPVERLPMNVAEQFIHAITDPNIAYLLLSLGTLLVLAEVAEPGLGLPGIGAVVCFVIAFVALGSLPFSWAGLVLLALAAVIFFVALITDLEAVLTVAALVPFILGSLLLFTPFTPTAPAMPSLTVDLWLIVLMAVVIVLFSLVILRAVVRASRLPVQSGPQRLIGMEGVARSDLDPTGQVSVDLQEWSALSIGGPIRQGTRIRVVGVAGVRLHVVPLEERAPAEAAQEGDA